MLDISDSARARVYLSEAEFHFSRALGQNFLLDDARNAQIAALSGAGEGTNVLEVGPGAGTLTCALARAGARVVAVEIDRALEGILAKMLEPFAATKVIYNDICKTDIRALADEEFGPGAPYLLVSNLPYAIAAELLPRIVSGERPPQSITAMVQKEAAERMCAQPGEKNWCALAARMQYFCEMEILDVLPPHAFTPNAHVESALIGCRYLAREERPAQPQDEQKFLRCLEAAFAMRRKTYANNLSAAFSMPKERAAEVIAQAGLKEGVRGETLTLAQIAAVSDRL
ncbi:MAG: 16S rRNA (adenine(1518)-N(6)/adenine(1519)-N(6))-dimethyltransferase RsmA [Eubacteriales bacterium]|nr:16S rRNA (adenine(1518)-N(6)/adenine(1519)-N(6))-dimethyltransferase RsmA [Eubacteriales bacterium]